MEQPTQSEVNTNSIYRGLKKPNTSLTAHAQLAVDRLDIAECTRLVGWADDHPSVESTSTLGILTAKPEKGRACRAWRRQPWINMRVLAIGALAKSGSSLSAPFLARSLMYETGIGRAIAKEALQKLGARAVPALLQSIQTSSDWTLDGMLETIAALPRTHQPTLYRTLYHILVNHLPDMSERWLKHTIRTSMSLGFAVVLIFAPGTISNMIPTAMAASLILSVVCAGAAGLVIKHMRNQEAMKLAAAAADAIISMRDPRYVAMLVDVAAGRFSYWSRYAAMRALAELLPGSSIKSYYKLDSAHEQKLSGLLGAKVDALTLAVVRSLEFVGTGQSVGALEQFVRSRSAADDTKPGVPALLEAQRVVPILQERRRKELAQSTLLRPAQFDKDSGQLLLRPAPDYTSGEMDAEELLRADCTKDQPIRITE